MKKFPYVIAGGGMVAGYAAKELVERGLKAGGLAIVSADDSLPYERPPLSKGFLAGRETEESIRINAAGFYPEHEIEVRVRSTITALDVESKMLFLESGEEIGFEKLVLATGAQVRRLEIPGHDLAGLCYLRSLDDSKRIRREAENAKQAVVTGGGFIGMEVAAVLAQKGIPVTMVLREERIWRQFFTPRMSEFFENYYGARNVRFVRQAKIAELHGRTEVQSVLLEGGESLSCDLVVAGIGVRPVTKPFAKSGIEIHDGIVVNEYLESSRPGIYAAGDTASYQDTLFGKRRRVEHWDNAVSQGQHCARMLVGDRTPFVHVPYFFSDVFDLSYEFWGDPSGADAVIERGDLTTTSFSVWWLREGRLVAAFVMNRPDEERETAPRWIEARQKVIAERLGGSQSIAGAAGK
ncbi:MAG TPA: FAD-dependent oxidoreductase [Bryobacteraceae bacterium]|nr:FAD-dependent oxidoreductase [Bryobacteraceae bacterium]